MTTRRTFINGSTPTVLLVHGAFADASSWTGVVGELLDAGIDVRAPANPLRGLIADAAYLAGLARAIDGPVLLAGHAYGGAVITQAGSQEGNVVGLVFVAAFAPDQGENLLDIAARHPDTLLAPALRPGTFPTGAEFGVELSLSVDRFPAVFAADLPERAAAAAAVAQRPIASIAFEERVAAAAWRTLPSWAVIATADRAIHPDAQRFMARRAGADTIEIDASHAVALTRPAEVAAHIRRATRESRS
ncbi:alpha/beta hydrolase [Streptosporangiaceae bacterium NEAU-GS5]|nr:alpha/beta hydrolase [Streptosporangiaceae bacterium NEAU-GS5]